MIVAQQKPLEEMIQSLGPAPKVLVAGCNECVTVCEAGGRKEVGVVASALRLYYMNQGAEVEVSEVTLERQCDREYLEEVRELVQAQDAVLTLACGVGCQFMAEGFPGIPVNPGVNTVFMGGKVERGMWSERCQGCGACILATTGGICPVSRCAKRVLNGPCGGSTGGKCEISRELDCAWQLIIDRLESLGRLDDYEKLAPLKDWSFDRAGGPRTVVREDVQS